MKARLAGLIVFLSVAGLFGLHAVLRAQATCPCSLWTPTTTPGPLSPDPNGGDVGIKFTSDTAGFITGMRFYKYAQNTGTHTGSLWTTSGTRLATVTFTGETASGWQQANFPTPIAITANTTYVISYFTPTGYYAITEPGFTVGVNKAPLHAPANTTSNPNGVYRYGTTTGFPNQTWNASNYWVDPIFVTSVIDTTAPTITSTSPVNGSTNVPVSSTVKATFSEPMTASTISTSTIDLHDANNVPVSASVSYSASTQAATLTPSALLIPGMIYTTRVYSGSGGVKDLAGNALAADAVWMFTAAPPDLSAPTVTAITPGNGATGVSTATAVTASFSEAMDPSSITTSTLFLQKGSTAVAATVAYNATTNVATLTPTGGLANATAYTATVKSGSGGVRDAAGNPLAADVTWSFTTSTTSSQPTGQWTGVMSWPLVTLNATVLRTGDLLVWDGGTSVGDAPTNGGLSAKLWNPNTQAFTSVPNNMTDLFCSSSCALADGRIFVAGGADPTNNNQGSADANIYDPVSRSWSGLPQMSARRWYPTATCLPDGRALVTSGSQFTDTDWVRTPEIYSPATNTWSKLTGATATIPYYPHEFVLPDGRVLTSSSFAQPMVSNVLNLSTQARTTVDSHTYTGGSAVQYLPGKILKTGSAASNSTSRTSSVATAYLLDMTTPAPAWQKTNSMNFPRNYHTLTSLPDGTVLVTGGGRTLDSTDTGHAVYEAEIWSPVTKTWTTMARMKTPRLYHSTAILLPDARVLVAGGGRNFYDGQKQLNAEIYSPPYLFKGTRPTITSAADTVGYSATMTVQTPDAANIASVALMHLGSVTHGFNEDQRFIPLTFQAVAGELNVQTPANVNLAPPGYYMLFIVNAAGVPSTATFVHLQP